MNLNRLLLLLGMQSVLSESRAVLFHPQLLAAWFPLQRVVVITRFFTHEEDCFSFLLAFGHREGVSVLDGGVCCCGVQDYCRGGPTSASRNSSLLEAE